MAEITPIKPDQGNACEGNKRDFSAKIQSPVNKPLGKGMLEKIIFSEKNTPVVSLNPNGMITIKGRSVGGNLHSFYRQIDDWVEEYISDAADLTCVDVYLEYLKGFDLKIYISLLKKISSVGLKNKKCVVNWYYEEGDDDMFDAGESISMILNQPFNFIRISDPNHP